MTATELAFRNVDASPTDPVETWPYEGLVAAIERGLLPDWRRVARAIDRSPWGQVARWVEDYSRYGEERAVSALLAERVRRAREAARASDRVECAVRVRAAVERSGMTARDFARECGTSPTRLSTYRTGKVQPSAAMLIRFERVADRQAAASTTAR